MPDKQNIETPLYFLKEESYTGSHDYFYDTTSFPQIQELEKKWEIIRDEIRGLISGSESIEVTNLNPPYLSAPGVWKNIYFSNFGWKKHQHCKKYPKTYSILQSYPNIIFAGITVLEPHSRILPHNGETNTTIRCHLGLRVPAPYPVCGVKVGPEERGWQDGKVLMFSDAHYHSTWNDSDERRFVLVFDIVRDEYADKKHSVSANILGALSLKYFYNLRPRLKELPMPIIKFWHSLFTGFWYLYLPLQNRFPLP